MRVPVMSDGNRSGVNWMRLNVPPTALAIVSTDRVFANPGTDSSRQWPPEMRHTSMRSMARSWPTITFLISNSTRSSVSASPERAAGVGAACGGGSGEIAPTSGGPDGAVQSLGLC